MKTFFNRLGEIRDFTISMSEIERRKKVLDFMLWGISGMAGLGWLSFLVYSLVRGDHTSDVVYILIGMPCLVFGIALIARVNQKQTGYLAGILTVVILFLGGLLDQPAQIAAGRSLLYFSLPIVLSSLIITPATSFFVAGIATLVNMFYVYLTPNTTLNSPAIISFFFLAFVTWLATSSLEKTIKNLNSANQALRKSEERYRTLLEISPEMIWVSSLQGAFEMVNRACLEVLGCETEAEILGKNIWELIDPVEHAEVREKHRQMIMGEIEKVPSMEVAYRKKDGRTLYLEIKNALVRDANSGKPIQMIGVGRDVTLRRMTEQKLLDENDRLEDTVRESEAAYQNLFENSDQGLILAQNGRVLKANQAFARICGLTLPELYHCTIEELHALIQTDELKSEAANIWEGLTEGLVQQHEIRLTLKDGQRRWVDFTPQRVKFMGQPAFQLTAIDRTQHKQAELALAQSEERYRVLAETAHDLIYIVDANGRVKYINQYAASLFGKKPEELVGQSLTQLFPPAVSERWEKTRKATFETGETYYAETQAIFPQQVIWLSSWLVPMRDPTGKVNSVLGISHNIDHLKELEASLREAKEGLEDRVAERTAELNTSREQLHELTRQLVTVLEDERRRVSRELHDEAGQILIGLKYRLGEALTSLTGENADARQRISAAMAGTDQAMTKIRTLAHDLRPPTLDVAGINLTLQSYCREFSELAHLPVKYQGAELPGLNDQTSISLYRILQESLTNITRHAPQATHIEVTLSRAQNTLTLTIADNGPGYQPRPDHAGIGLLGIQERLALLGGRLEILPNGRQGTRLKAIIPLNAGQV